MKRIFSILFLLLLIVGTWYILKGAKYRVVEGPVFGTTYRVKYEATEDLADAIEQELQRVDGALSMFNDSSTLSLFNKTGEVKQKDAYFDAVVRLALRISAETGGAFDITVAPLVEAWGFGRSDKAVPSAEKLDSLMPHIGAHHLTYDERRNLLRRDDAGVKIDCAAIAKGYAVDCIAALLRKHGVSNYMVEIGGEVSVLGHNDKGHAWKVGIARPTTGSNAVQGETEHILTLRGKALATSGNYHNYYEVDGRRYAHTIDPHTGRPVQHDVLSATVIAPTCAEADAYATAFMVMGREKARAFVKAHKALKAYLIYAKPGGELATDSIGQ